MSTESNEEDWPYPHFKIHYQPAGEDEGFIVTEHWSADEAEIIFMGTRYEAALAILERERELGPVPVYESMAASQQPQNFPDDIPSGGSELW